MVGSTMPENLTSPTLKARPLARRAQPAQKKTQELPQGIEARGSPASPGLTFEVAGEEPEIGLHVELGHDPAHSHARRPPR